MSTIQNNQKIEFQVLRGVCCVFICLNHLSFFNKYSFGEIGVEFFIILSGLLTAYNADRHHGLRRGYLLDKIRKVLPMYWAITVFLFIVGRVKPSIFSSTDVSISNLIASLLLIPGHELILYPGWTLSFFFIFYIIYWVSNLISNKERDFIAVALICLYVSIGGFIYFLQGNQLVADFTNPIMLEFAYGVVLFHVYENIRQVKRNNTVWWKCLSIGIMTILFFNYNKFLGPRYFIPSMLTCLVILIFQVNDNSIYAKFWSSIGNISFTIYILHPLIIRPMDKILIRLVGSMYSPIYFLGVCVIILLTIIICFFFNNIICCIKSKFLSIK